MTRNATPAARHTATATTEASGPNAPPVSQPGVHGETGTPEARKFVDIVAVPRKVLRDIAATERPVMMMKQGLVVKEGITARDSAPPN